MKHQAILLKSTYTENEIDQKNDNAYLRYKGFGVKTG
jgi:hypothetical protein